MLAFCLLGLVFALDGFAWNWVCLFVCLILRCLVFVLFRAG